MQLSVHKDILFFFATFLIVGINASAQSEPTPCALKVFVNDPFAQIFVDGKELGAQPQMILCSHREKNILVKSSDGQIFSRLMKSVNDFDLTNSTLNVVFHRKSGDTIYQTGTPVPAKAVFERAATEQVEQSIQKIRDLSSESHVQVSVAPTPKLLLGTYVQIFALKKLDMSKIEQDMQLEYNGKVTEREFTICPWKSSRDSETMSLVLVGPFNKRSSALEVRNRIGGKSFLVADPKCTGDFTKVNR
jgi:hypothetical protein